MHFMGLKVKKRLSKQSDDEKNKQKNLFTSYV